MRRVGIDLRFRKGDFVVRTTLSPSSVTILPLTLTRPRQCVSRTSAVMLSPPGTKNVKTDRFQPGFALVFASGPSGRFSFSCFIHSTQTFSLSCSSSWEDPLCCSSGRVSKFPLWFRTVSPSGASFFPTSSDQILESRSFIMLSATLRGCFLSHLA